MSHLLQKNDVKNNKYLLCSGFNIEINNPRGKPYRFAQAGY